MNHKIVLTPSISGSDYLKALAGLNVDPKLTFGVRYFTDLELAKYMMQYSGVLCERKFITNLCLAARLYKGVKEIDYFKEYSFTDVYNLLQSVNNLRKCIAYNEPQEIKKLLNVDSFKRKNVAIVQFYDLLMTTFEKENLIDEIGLIRYALDNASTIPNVEFVRYEEFDYQALSIALLNKANGNAVHPTKLFVDKKPKIATYTKAYGQNSEIEDILAYIYKNNISFDECLIVAPDTATYEKILTNYQAVLKYPLVVNTGQSINDTNSGRLLGSIISWAKSRYHKDLLQELIYSQPFNLELFKADIEYKDEDIEAINNQLGLKYYDVLSFELIIETAGNLRLGLTNSKISTKRISEYENLILKRIQEDSKSNIYQRDKLVLNYVKKINSIFEKDLIYFLERYCLINENNKAVELNALEKFVDVLSLADYYGIGRIEAIKFLDDVVVGKRKPQEGALFLSSIDNAISFLRKHLFVVGLDSKTFPGKVMEDPIILDQDYKLFDVPNYSLKQINDKKKQYHNLVGVASSLGIDIHLSYACYNSETAKEQNASSVFFETYKDQNGENKTVNDLNKEFEDNKQNKYRLVGFFDNDLFPLSVVGRKAKENIAVVPWIDREPEEDDPIADIEDIIEEKFVDASSLISKRGLSWSAIEKYINCQYEFFLNSVLRVDQEKDTKLYEIIPANDLGNLAHDLMENYSSNLPKVEFLEKCEETFREYLIAHPSDNKQQEEEELKDFLDMMENGFEMELAEHCPSVLREEDVFAIHEPSKLKIHGFPDKVLKLPDGTYRVVDYKTGSSVKHNPTRKGIKTMLQGALYAYILENGKNKLNGYGKYKITVSEFVFRYLKNKVSVYSSNSKDKLTMNDYYLELETILNQIKESVETGVFEKNGKCEGCYFKSVCGGKK